MQLTEEVLTSFADELVKISSFWTGLGNLASKAATHIGTAGPLGAITRNRMGAAMTAGKTAKLGVPELQKSVQETGAKWAKGLGYGAMGAAGAGTLGAGYMMGGGSGRQ